MEMWKIYYSLSESALLLPRLRLAVVGFEPWPRHIVCVVDNVRVGWVFSEIFGYPRHCNPTSAPHQWRILVRSSCQVEGHTVPSN